MGKADRPREEGAALVEFAFVAPVLLIIVFGFIYGMLWAAAELSLSHAVTEAARVAAIPDPQSGLYPAAEAVTDEVYSSTPFFAPPSGNPASPSRDCVVTVTGDLRPNAPVNVSAVCDFPNPAGMAARALGGLFSGSSQEPFPAKLTISAAAERSRE